VVREGQARAEMSARFETNLTIHQRTLAGFEVITEVTFCTLTLSLDLVEARVPAGEHLTQRKDPDIPYT
jgi:hypothetical protein